MYLDTKGVSSTCIYRKSVMPRITPVMLMQHTVHLEGRTSRSPSIHYSTLASSAHDIGYCRLCCARLHHAPTCPLLSGVTHILIINTRHINLVNLPPRNLSRSGNQSPTCSGKYIPNSFHLRNRNPRRNCVTIQNTHHLGRTCPNTHRSRNYSLQNSAKQHCRSYCPLLWHMRLLHQPSPRGCDQKYKRKG